MTLEFPPDDVAEVPAGTFQTALVEIAEALGEAEAHRVCAMTTPERRRPTRG